MPIYLQTSLRSLSRRSIPRPTPQSLGIDVCRQNPMGVSEIETSSREIQSDGNQERKGKKRAPHGHVPPLA